MYHKAIMCAAISGLIGLIFGYDMGISGGIVHLVQSFFALNASAMGFALSIYIIGASIGSLLTHTCNSYFGRKKTLILFAGLMFFSSVGMYFFGENYTGYLLCRGLEGLGMGLLFSSVPSYITEIAPRKIRGALGSIVQLTTGLGIMIGFALVYIAHETPSALNSIGIYPQDWMSFYQTKIIPNLLYFLLLFFIIESPFWYLLKKRIHEAKQSFQSFFPDEDVELYLEHHKTLYTDTQSHRNHDTIQTLKANNKWHWLLLIAFCLPALNELTGINAIIYYAPDIFGNILHSSSNSAYFYSIVNGLFFSLGSLFSMVMVDRFGRKFLLITGISTMTLCLLIIGVEIYRGVYSILLIYCIYAFIFTYNYSTGAIRFLYLGELCPASLRTSILGFGGVVNWASSVLTLWMLPILANNSYLTLHFHSAAVYFVFAAICFIYLLFIFTLPETKGKSLHEIAKYWSLAS